MLRTAWNILLVIMLFVQGIGPVNLSQHTPTSSQLNQIQKQSLFQQVDETPVIAATDSVPPTETTTPTETATPTETETPAPPVDTPVPSDTASPTETIQPGQTPEPSLTASPATTDTETPTATASESASPTATTPEEMEVSGDDVEIDVPANGANISINQGRLKLKFGKAALSEAMRLRVRKLDPETLPSSLSGEPFEIVAIGKHTQKAIKKFKKKFTLELTYNPEWFQGHESELRIFYLDEATSSWMPLPGEVDTNTHTIIAHSDHLTVFDFDIDNYQPGLLPSVQDFQVSDMTGAASYSFPIQLPAGPGGISYPFTLNYSSQVVDEMSAGAQSGWVGMGWSLETGYIQRNTMGSLDWTQGDSFTLNLNGSSYQLWTDMSGNYHTADESFLKIVADEDTSSKITEFTVYDKTGIRYDFTGIGYYPAYSALGTPECSFSRNIYWQYPLTKVTYPTGQWLDFEYRKETKSTNHLCDEGSTKGMVTAVILTGIEYSNHRYMVEFYAKPDRTDANNSSYDGARRFFNRSRLVMIRTYHAPNTPGDYTETIREYDFRYAGDENLPHTHIFPSYEFDKGDGHLTLLRIDQYGWKDQETVEQLPSIDFTYGDDMHLTSATNGYGGSVSFEYSAWHDVDSGDSRSWNDSCNGVGYWRAVSGNIKYDEETPGQLYVSDVVRYPLPKSMIRPGAIYQLKVNFLTSELGAFAGLATNKTEYRDNNHLTNDYLQEEILLPADDMSSGLNLRIHCPEGCYLSGAAIKIYPTYYHVTKKTVLDGMRQASIFEYRYDEMASNTKINSALGSNPFVPEYGEFRGSGMSDVLQPDGTIQTTWYGQTDNAKGKPAISALRSELFYQPFEEDSQEMASAMGVNYYHVVERSGGDAALKLYGYENVANPPDPETPRNLLSRPVSPTADMVMLQIQPLVDSPTLVYFPYGQEKIGLCSRSDNSEFAILKLNETTCPSLPSAGLSIPMPIEELGVAEGFDFKRPPFRIPQLPSTQLIREPDSALGSWYNVLFLFEDNQTRLWVWKIGDPGMEAQWVLPAVTNRTLNIDGDGLIAIDNYSEGKLYQLSFSDYSITRTMIKRPYNSDMKSYTGIWIRRMDLVAQTNYAFEGARWVATRKEYEYDPAAQIDQTDNVSQYGNLTQVTELHDKGVRNTSEPVWETDRVTKTSYRPRNDGNTYIVALPSQVEVWDGATRPNLLARTQYFYDDQSSYDATPGTKGLLTVQRSLVMIKDFTNYYHDEKYGYDTRGNRTDRRVYTGYGTDTAFASLGEQRTETCYGSFSGATCAPDDYAIYPRAMRNALGQVTTVDYDERRGLPVSETNPNGAVTTATYDGFGRLLTLTRPGATGANVTITYSDNPYIVDIVQRLDGNTSYHVRQAYDGLGRLRSKTIVGAIVYNGTQNAAQNLSVEYTYDALGRLTEQSEPHIGTTAQRSTQTEYDALGRPVTVTSPDGITTSYTYAIDYSGTEISTVTQAIRAGKTTRSTADLRGRLVEVQISGAGVAALATQYSYDAMDRLVAATTGGMPATTIRYDLGGRKTGMDDPDMGVWTYQYDALGNLKQQTDARGCTVWMGYDNLNRLKARQYAGLLPACNDTSDVYYTYDRYLYQHYDRGQENSAIGRRTEMLDGSGLATWYYDARGRATAEYRQVRDAGVFATRWTYNEADLPVAVTYPGGNAGQAGEVVHYTYLPQKAPASVIGKNANGEVLQNYLTSSGYDESGRWLARQVNSRGETVLKSTRSFDGATGRLAGITGQVGNEAAFLGLGYTYTDTGNIHSITDTGTAAPDVQEYTYDVFDRLTRAQVGGYGEYTENYSYEATGLLASKGGVDYTYGDPEHPHAVTGLEQNDETLQAYTYDADGNMMTRQVAGISYALTYDGDNRLVENRRSDNAAETYRYDGDGKLIERWSDGEHTIYIGGLLEIAIRPTGTPTATATRTGRPSRTPDTATPIGLTPTPSATRRPTYTPTKSLTPSRTASPTHVHTKTRTPTIPASATVTPTPTITRTVFTATPSKTPFTPVITLATATFTPSVSRTPTRTWTATLAPTQTKSLTPTKTATATKTASKSPTPTLTDTPSPTATSIDTVTPVATRATAYPGGETWTFYYYAGSERIALRVSTGESSAVYFLFGDHLGSTTVVMNANGVQQAVTKYKAFGEQRATPQEMMTNRLYTGQLEIGFGLYHYGARVVDPTLGRFVSSDTIISNPLDPMTFDRYAYVSNNPVLYNDPSGHCAGTDEQELCGTVIPKYGLSSYGITLQGSWSTRNTRVAYEAVKDEGQKYASTKNTPVYGMSSREAFRTVHRKGITFIWGASGAADFCNKNGGFYGGACTSSATQINFVSLVDETISIGGVRTVEDAYINARNNVVHELGHAFASIFYRWDANKQQSTYDSTGPYMNILAKLLTEQGFVILPDPNKLTWRQHPGDLSRQEIFADLYLGWTYDGMGFSDTVEGNEKRDFMEEQMSIYISAAIR